MDENDEWDGPWKDALDRLPEVFALFWPDVLEEVDVANKPKALEQELQAFAPHGNSKLLRVDKLFEMVAAETGDPRYAHFEAQVPRDGELPWRMFKYGRRAGDHFNQPIGRFAILGDDDPRWRPTEYREGVLGCEDVFTFRIAKLIDWRGRMGELEAGENLFGLFVCAHLETMRTKGDAVERAEAKFRLLVNLLRREVGTQEIRVWYRLIDWIMKLPEDANRAVWQRLQDVKEPKVMSYVPFAERYYTEIGVEKGLKESIRNAIAVKFPEVGDSLASAFEAEHDPERLRAVHSAAVLAQSPEDFRARVAAT